MANVTVTNTDANLSAKTVVVAENAQTITGLQTFDRDPSAPFAVTSSSAVVTNLDADKLDGLDGSAYLIKATDAVWSSKAFSAGDYTASSGNWTVASGDVLMNNYMILNK